jgi:PAS domain S-box-containing protein
MFSAAKKIWSKIILIGSGPELTYHQKIRLHTLNGFAVISILFVLLFSAIFTAIGSYTSLQSLPIAGVMLGVLWLNSRRHYELAKGFMTILLNIIILGMALLDRRTGTEYVLLASACSAILLFDNTFHIAISFALALGSFAGYIWYDAAHPFVPDPTVPYEFMSGVVMLVSACTVGAQLLIYRSLINTYARELQEANEKVVVMNKELKSSYEEQQTLALQLDWIVKQKDNELQSYLDAINVHVYSAVTDSHGMILKVNEPLINITGYGEQELIGKKFSEFIEGHPSELLIGELIHTISKGKTWRGEVKNKKKDGTFYWIDMVVIPLKSEKGTSNYFLTLALPITERKEAEAQREKVAKMLEDIAFRASHKVRAPIARIRGLTNLIDLGIVEKDELAQVMRFVKESVLEMDVATSELTNFVNIHYEERATPIPAETKQNDRNLDDSLKTS